MSQPSSTPLLSILIPTKDRYKTLVPVVQQNRANIDDGRLEIVVCDNSNGPDFVAVAQLIGDDARVSYYRTDEDLPMSANWERGIASCWGEHSLFVIASGIEVHAVEQLAILLEKPEIVATNPNYLPKILDGNASIRPDLKLATI